MSRIRVLLAEEHSPLRLSIRTVLCESKEIFIADESGNSEDLLKLLNNTPEPYDLCILSISLPIVSSYKTLLGLRASYPDMRIIILSQYANKVGVRRVLLDGATAFILKENIIEELLDAVFSVYEDDLYFNSIVTPQLMRTLQNRTTVKSVVTQEELLFLSHCCNEKIYDNIAEELNISSRKAQHLRESLFRKLEVSCRSGLALAAVQLGLYRC